MSVVQLNNVSVSYGAQRVLDRVSLALSDGERAGLVGVNGCGKTTLLRIIAGTLTPDAGLAARRKGLRIGYLEQEPDLPEGAGVHDAALSAFSDLLDIEERMRRIEHEIAAAPPERRHDLLQQLGHLQHRFEHEGGYVQEARTGEVLHGLGFTEDEFSRPVSVLSGGERTRLALARLLLREADLLILDEPTNHLDLAGIEWLETFLQKKFRGAVLVVSHDRLFLDRVARRIVELDHAGLEEYPGNYTKYAEVKAFRRAERQRLFDMQQEHIRKEEDFIARYHAAQRGREARGRLKRLSRIERLEAPTTNKQIAVRFDVKRESGETAFRAEELSMRFGERTLFRKLSCEVYRGESIGIIGPNGSGKSTLLQILMGRMEPAGGSIQIGHNVHIGYLEQQIGDVLSERTVLDEVWERNRKLKEVEVRSLLGRFLFSDEETIQKRLCDLSGGERTRVALARLMIDRPNVLVLDEPTNHLDIPSREALEEALEDYDGAIVAVSHDRYFINRIVEKLLVLDGASGACRLVLGNYEDYERLREREAAEAAERAAQSNVILAKAGIQGSPGDVPSGQEPPKSKPRMSKNRLAKLEEEISRLEQEKTALEEDLARPDLYSDPEKARETPRRYRAVCEQLEKNYAEWTEQSG